MILHKLKPAISTTLASSSSPLLILNMKPYRSLSLSPSPSRPVASLRNPMTGLFDKLRSDFRSSEAVASSDPPQQRLRRGPTTISRLPANSSRNSVPDASGVSNWPSRGFQGLPRPRWVIHKGCFIIQPIMISVRGLLAIPRLLGFSMIPRNVALMIDLIFSGLGMILQRLIVGSGIYFYTPDQEKTALESMEKQQKQLNRKIVTEIPPAKNFYRAEEYHQQYLAKGGRFGFRNSTEKGYNDPIRCYG